MCGRRRTRERRKGGRWRGGGRAARSSPPALPDQASPGAGRGGRTPPPPALALCSVLDLHLQAVCLDSGARVHPLPGGAGVSCNRQAFPTWSPNGSIRFTSDLVENSRDQTACQAYTFRKPQSGPYNLSLTLSSVFIQGAGQHLYRKQTFTLTVITALECTSCQVFLFTGK